MEKEKNKIDLFNTYLTQLHIITKSSNMVSKIIGEDNSTPTIQPPNEKLNDTTSIDFYFFNILY